MKVVVIFFVALTAFVYSLPTKGKDFKEEWEKFKEKYNKSYSTPDEENERFELFKYNLVTIEGHNELYEKGLSTYKQGINGYADFGIDHIEQFFSKHLLENPTSLTGKMFKKTKGFVLPESVDWRQQGIVSEVHDQLADKCGSCWSFSASGSVEGQYALKTGKLISLSEQNLIDCNKKNGGCNGGSNIKALEYIKENGLESEKDYPYEARDGECRRNSSKIVTKISSYMMVPAKDELALQEAVTKIGPLTVYIDFSVQTSFTFYESGIYDGSCSTSMSTHAVLLVGFGKENGKDYYLIKNSMGTDWGESGYFKIERNVGGKCCLAFGALYPIL